MVTRLYKVYKASDYNSIDQSNVDSNIRWSLDNTEFIVEFKTAPIAEEGVLSHNEAKQLMQTEKWILTTDIL